MDTVSLKARGIGPAAALAGYLAAAIALTWPLALHPASRIAYFQGDPMLNAYLLAWNQHALLHRPWGIFSPNFLYPLRDALGLSENLIAPALLTLPLAAFGNPILVYNAVFFGAFVVSACAWDWALRRWGTGAFAAWLGGLLFAFLPYKFGQLGHIQLAMDAWIPLALAGTDDWLRGRNRRGALLAAAALAGQFYSCVYLFYFLFLFLVPFVAAGWAAIRPERKRWQAMLAEAALAAVLAGLALAPAVASYREIRSMLYDPNTLESIASRGASFGDYLRPAGFNLVYGSLSPFGPNGYSDFPWEHLLWLGWTALLAALSLPLALLASRRRAPESLLGPVRQRAWMLACGGIFLGLISLGPVFHWRGQAAYDLPWYRWLFHGLPGFEAIRVPTRAVALAGLALTGIAAFAIDLWIKAFARPAARKAFCVFLAILAAADLANRPLPVGDNPDFRRHRAVQEALAPENPGVILSLPVDATSYLAPLASVGRFDPVVNGASGYMPSANGRIYELFRAPEWGRPQIELLRWLGVRTILFDSALQPSAPEALKGIERGLESAGILEKKREFGSEQLAALTLAPQAPPVPPAKPSFKLDHQFVENRPGFNIFLNYESASWMLADGQRRLTIEIRGADAGGKRLWKRTIHSVLQQFLVEGWRAGWPVKVEPELWNATQDVEVKFQLSGLGIKLEGHYPRKPNP